MKTLILWILVLTIVSVSNAQNVYIPDANFKNALIEKGVDTDEDGEISYAEAEAITAYIEVNSRDISDMTGIEAFVNLQALSCNNNRLSILIVKQNQELQYLDCSSNFLRVLDISNNPLLQTLRCEDNQLVSLNISNNPLLQSLRCESNLLTSLDISNNHVIGNLDCSNNHLSELDLRNGNNLWMNLNAQSNYELLCISVDDENYIPPEPIWFVDNREVFSNACGAVPIPDSRFEDILIDLGIDSDGSNGQILCSDAFEVTELNVRGKSITDLTGIEAFVNLETLDCSYNLLRHGFDVSLNPKLSSLDCFNNSLLNLDVSMNSKLLSIDCSNNLLTSLDISNNHDLGNLDCSNNHLSELDLRNGNNLSMNLNAQSNYELLCISVDDENNIPPEPLWFVDIRVEFSNACGAVPIPDSRFEEVLTHLGIDSDGSNGQIQRSDAFEVTELNVSGYSISDLTGIEAFENLQTLNCSHNLLSRLDVSLIPKLSYLDCNNNSLNNLDVSKNSELISLDCSNNLLTSLDISNNHVLEYLDCSNNHLSELDLRNGYNPHMILNAELNEELYCISVDDETAGHPKWLYDSDVILSGSRCIKLTPLEILLRYNHTGDNDLIIYNGSIINSGYSPIDIGLSATDLTSDHGTIPVDKKLSFGFRSSGSSTYNSCGDITSIIQIVDLNLQPQESIQLEIRLVVNESYPLGIYSAIVTITAATSDRGLPFLPCDYLIPPPPPSVIIPEPNFEQALIDLGIDSDGTLNQQILKTDAEAVTNLDVHAKEISDLTGIEGFVNLTSLNCENNQLVSLDISNNTLLTSLICQNNQLPEINVSNNTELEVLMCGHNQLTDLDLSNNLVLKSIYCDHNQLSIIDLSNNTELKSISCNKNQLTSLQVSHLTQLQFLECSDNQITSLDVSNNLLLTQLYCHHNQLLSLDVSQNLGLFKLYCYVNQFTELDVTQNTELLELMCHNNQLTNIDISNNIKLQRFECFANQLIELDVSQNPDLYWIRCGVNPLTELDLSYNINLNRLECDLADLTHIDMRNGNNHNMISFNAKHNDNLTCISVDDETADHSSWLVDPEVVFSNDCNYNTPEGENVAVDPIDETTGTTPVEMTFEDVTSSGNTTLEISGTGPEAPEGFAFGDPTTYYNIETTAEHSGIIQIVIDYSGIVYPDEEGLRLLHYESDEWVDVTTMLDTENDKIYGEVMNLSSFAVLKDIEPPVLIGVPADETVECNAIPDPAVVNTEDNVDGSIPVILSEETLDGSCPNSYTLVRTWTASDAAGNTASASQIITVEDNNSPTLTVPADVTIECDMDNSPATTSMATATDNCDASPVISYLDEQVSGSCANEYTINRTWSATDECGNVATALQLISVVDGTMSVISGVPATPIVQGNDAGYCGAFIDYPEITATDNCSDLVNLTLEPSSGALFLVGITTVTVTAMDDCGNTATASFDVEITNEDPVIESLTAPVDPIQLGVIVNTTAEFTDNNLSDAVWDWGDGTSSAGMIDGQTITGDHQYEIPGVYILKLTITDMCGETDTEIYQYVVVYDPNGGFITGGGWINSPPGAYTDDPLLEGKANFGFVSKYKKGEDIPVGNTEFQFNAGDLKFKSTSYYWLVIAGSKAKFKGDGSVNNVGDYGFMISAIDGDLKDNGEDRFRIKIWDMADETVIYDNEIEADENQDPTTELGGGSIVIHTPKTKGSGIFNEEFVSFENDGDIMPTMLIYPNPAKDNINIVVSGKEEQSIQLKIFNSTGQLIYISSGKGMINEEISLDDNKSGLYSVIAVVDGKLIIQKVLIE